MDRSFLSDTAVIEAARNFVCVRIATYEDEDEADFVRSRLMGGAEDLRNFGFALASPDFEVILRRSERGPNFVYRDATAMAEELNRVAAALADLLGDAMAQHEALHRGTPAEAYFQHGDYVMLYTSRLAFEKDALSHGLRQQHGTMLGSWCPSFL